MAETNKMSLITKGIIKENPVLRLVLGTCPTLAVTTAVSNALGMGAAATVVLICSNIVVSALRKIIPDKVHLPCYITIIATFVTVVQMVVKAFLPELDVALGVYLPLIVVNCIILGRAEMYANKNGVVDSAIDAIGMGIGFTLALLLMASFREIFGAGTWFGMEIPVIKDYVIGIMTMSPGGFFVFGCCIALVNKFTKGKAIKKKEFSCAGCPSAAVCGNQGACGEKKEGAEA